MYAPICKLPLSLAMHLMAVQLCLCAAVLGGSNTKHCSAQCCDKWIASTRFIVLYLLSVLGMWTFCSSPGPTTISVALPSFITSAPTCLCTPQNFRTFGGTDSFQEPLPPVILFDFTYHGSVDLGHRWSFTRDWPRAGSSIARPGKPGHCGCTNPKDSQRDLAALGEAGEAGCVPD